MFLGHKRELYNIFWPHTTCTYLDDIVQVLIWEWNVSALAIFKLKQTFLRLELSFNLCHILFACS